MVMASIEDANGCCTGRVCEKAAFACQAYFDYLDTQSTLVWAFLKTNRHWLTVGKLHAKTRFVFCSKHVAMPNHAAPAKAVMSLSDSMVSWQQVEASHVWSDLRALAGRVLLLSEDFHFLRAHSLHAGASVLKPRLLLAFRHRRAAQLLFGLAAGLGSLIRMDPPFQESPGQMNAASHP